MAERLSALDATFLELEESDPGAHMHIGSVMVFAPDNGGAPPSLDALCAHVERRLGALPRFAQRLSAPVTGGLTNPSWEPAPSFSVAEHVRRAALPAPGGRGELLDWAADFWSHRLDRARPLWEMVLLEGLADGRWALATKTHHAMVDGVASVGVADLLLDTSPRARAGADLHAVQDLDVAAEPSGGDLLGVPRAIARGAGAGLHALTDPGSLGDVLRRSRALADLIVRDELVAAPATSLNRPLGKARRFAAVDAELDDLKLVKTQLGGTVNDVVLAAVAGGLRALLIDRGEAPPQAGLRAMVPVNIRAAADSSALGNRITSLFVHLPVSEPTPLGRYGRTLQEAERLKAGDQAAAGTTLVGLAGLAPPLLHAFAARALFATRLFNVTVTNVPAAPATLYAFGAPMRDVFGLVPLAAAHDVGIAVVSYDGRVTFGINADRATMPDLDVLTAGLRRSLDELVTMARGSRAVREAASAGVGPA